MKLIIEQNFNDIQYITEETKEGQKQLFIEGVFLQSNKKNRNGRIYEEKVLRPAVDKFNEEYVKTNRALGELLHPNSSAINLDRVSHRITELNWKGDDITGKALVLNTPTGQIVKGLLEGGSQLGVSSRGMGSLEERNGAKYVKNDFILSTIDIVSDPSAPDAFVNGILEGVEFIFDSDGRLVQREAEVFEKRASKRIKKSRHYINESNALKKLHKFLSSL